MIGAAFAIIDQGGHHFSGNGCILVLVPACPAGHVETAQRGFVIDRNPVGRGVVQIDNPARLRRYAEARHALAVAHHLVVPLLGEIAGIFGIAVGPHMRIAGRVLASDQDVVAVFGADIAGDVGIRDDHPDVVEIAPLGRRHMRNFLAKRPCLDRHLVGDAGKPVDVRRGRPRHIDHNRRMDFLA